MTARHAGAMRRGTITLLRMFSVLLYAMGARVMGLDGVTAGEFGFLLVVGTTLFVVIAAADWVNGARRRDW